MNKRVLLGTIRNARNKNLRLNSVGQNRLVKPRLSEDRNIDQDLHYNPETTKACDDHNPNLKRHLAEMVQNKPIKYRALSSKIPGSNYSAEIGKVRYKIPKRKNMTLNNIEKEPEIGKGGPGSGRVDEDGDPTNNRNYTGPRKPKSNFGRNLLAGAGTAAAVGGLLHPATRGFAARALSRGGAFAARGAKAGLKATRPLRSRIRYAQTPRSVIGSRRRADMAAGLKRPGGFFDVGARVGQAPKKRPFFTPRRNKRNIL